MDKLISIIRCHYVARVAPPSRRVRQQTCISKRYQDGMEERRGEGWDVRRQIRFNINLSFPRSDVRLQSSGVPGTLMDGTLPRAAAGLMAGRLLWLTHSDHMSKQLPAPTIFLKFSLDDDHDCHAS